MYEIKTDPHTHTIFSGHAFGTIEDNVKNAAEAGLEAIAMTDHFGFGGKVSSAAPFGTNVNFEALPKYAHGVRIITGIEIDIADFEGNLAGHDTYLEHSPNRTVCEFALGISELTIASLHFFDGFKDGTAAQYTTMFCNAAANPGVDVIGHCGRNQVPFDIDELLKTAKLSSTFIEINEHSFDMGEKIAETCKKIALRCAELDVSVTVSSDAHSPFYIGKFGKAVAMLKEIGFPEKLIANLTFERLVSKLSKLRNPKR